MPQSIANNIATTAEDAASQRVLDGNGWAEIKGNPLSRVGVFPYSGASIPNAPDKNKIYNVLRPADELGAQECIDSFKLTPWISGHTMLGEGFTPAEQKGIDGVIGEDVYFDGDFLRGNIKMFTQKIADAVANDVTELSVGYRCAYEFKSGIYQGQPYDVIQRNIRGNHLALVPQGRCGPEVAVLDHLTFTFDAKEFSMADPVEKGAAPALDLEAIKAAIEQITPIMEMINGFKASLGAAEPAVTDAEIAVEVEKEIEDPAAVVDKCATMDAAELLAVVKKLQKQVNAMTTGMDASDVMAEIAGRDKMARRLSAVVGTFDHAEMTAAQVAKYGADKLGITCKAGHEMTAVDAYISAVEKSGAKTVTAHAQDSAVKTGATADAISAHYGKE